MHAKRAQQAANLSMIVPDLEVLADEGSLLGCCEIAGLRGLGSCVDGAEYDDVVGVWWVFKLVAAMQC